LGFDHIVFIDTQQKLIYCRICPLRRTRTKFGLKIGKIELENCYKPNFNYTQPHPLLKFELYKKKHRIFYAFKTHLQFYQLASNCSISDICFIWGVILCSNVCQNEKKSIWSNDVHYFQNAINLYLARILLSSGSCGHIWKFPRSLSNSLILINPTAEIKKGVRFLISA
jgi:hypothetical protein